MSKNNSLQPKKQPNQFTPNDWHTYYQQVLEYPQRPSTERAVALLKQQQLMEPAATVAVDCGCGIGRDSAWLLEQGFSVFGFDNAEQAIEVCLQRFVDQPHAHFMVSNFADYQYPEANLLIANASLFFCPEADFPTSWKNIVTALKSSGIIHVDLLGVDDSWVNDPEFNVSAFTRKEVDALFKNFEIVKIKERNEDGTTAIGTAKHWHSFHILAIKR
ncbi:SAM-dependent methyltransferase [Pelagibaculum spongiae]|uniref:SAM-dependent methyltransferase n=1 Tax=Pelagibaculum spongiae TaxID=2080658 RepID=A0A2V1GZF6_9GAMM|nr:SAM-dependent methyltransferase [Pelagibaculum spongiae]